jgi:hypothetical protein
MHSSRSDATGTSAGRFRTNVYTKKRRKLKITLEIEAASDLAVTRISRDLIRPRFDADVLEAVAALVRRAVSEYHPRQN